MSTDLLYMTSQPISLQDIKQCLVKAGFAIYVEKDATGPSSVTVFPSKETQYTVTDYCRWYHIPDKELLSEEAVSYQHQFGNMNAFTIVINYASLALLVSMLKAIMEDYGGIVGFDDLDVVYSRETIEHLTTTRNRHS